MPKQLKRGTIDLIILKMLHKKSYGYEIKERINEYFFMKESAIYLVISRLAANGLIDFEEKKCNGRMRKYYIINENGKNHLAELEKEYNAINQLLESLGEEHNETENS